MKCAASSIKICLYSTTKATQPSYYRNTLRPRRILARTLGITDQENYIICAVCVGVRSRELASRRFLQISPNLDLRLSTCRTGRILYNYFRLVVQELGTRYAAVSIYAAFFVQIIYLFIFKRRQRQLTTSYSIVVAQVIYSTSCLFPMIGKVVKKDAVLVRSVRCSLYRFVYYLALGRRSILFKNRPTSRILDEVLVSQIEPVIENCAILVRSIRRSLYGFIIELG